MHCFVIHFEHYLKFCMNWLRAYYTYRKGIVEVYRMSETVYFVTIMDAKKANGFLFFVMVLHTITKKELDNQLLFHAHYFDTRWKIPCTWLNANLVSNFENFWVIFLRSQSSLFTKAVPFYQQKIIRKIVRQQIRLKFVLSKRV